jgi:transcriptional regulator with XRE-family HTH domain
MDDNPSEAVDARARRRLRELRAERGLTLQQVAQRAAIDVSTLSRLESGKRRLALDHLPPLARALGVSADDLLGTAPAPDPRVPHRKARMVDGMTMWPLSHDEAAGGIKAYKIRIAGRRRTPPDPLPVHEGQEWIYVMSGTLRLRLADDEFLVKPGEAAEFSTLTPHWFGATDGPVELIALFGPQGQRVHLHT